MVHRFIANIFWTFPTMYNVITRVIGFVGQSNVRQIIRRYFPKCDMHFLNKYRPFGFPSLSLTLLLPPSFALNKWNDLLGNNCYQMRNDRLFVISMPYSTIRHSLILQCSHSNKSKCLWDNVEIYLFIYVCCYVPHDKNVPSFDETFHFISFLHSCPLRRRRLMK